jgi:uracil-DNA glycosylase
MSTESNRSINFVEEKYDWNNLSLWEFLEEGNVPSEWEGFFLRDDVQQSLFNISNALKEESKNVTIYPPIHQVFRAFIPMDKIKVVVLGMDPYHNGSAIGLCFSVLPGNNINPSLRNIYNELKDEEYKVDENGVLTHWADQGCLMLNTALTVEKGDADSHTGIWYEFSEKVIKYVAENTNDVVWLLMGSKAQAFQEFIPSNHRHRVLVTSHPSPFSAHRSFRQWPAFLGSNIFRQTNDFLKEKNRNPIKW